MKIAIIGHGKMGREIEAVAREQGETIAEIFDSKRIARAEDLAAVDVCIEFSTPQAAVSNIRTAVAAGKDVVVGTTGWYHHLPELREQIKASGLLHSANFSLGMNVFFRIVQRAAELVARLPEYDPYVHEIHHRQKADSPSGTALQLANILLAGIDRKTILLPKPPEGRIGAEMLHISSTRAGTAAGTHTVGFDSEADLIELRHVAKSRRGFALGALAAARWLRGRKGIYTMEDVEF